MRVLVCGGRDYNDYNRLDSLLTDMYDSGQITVIINGGARGADSMSSKWALKNNVPLEIYEANWDEHGRAAGPIRNQEMLDEGEPDLVIAFPGGNGTRDMVSRANKKGVKVLEVA